MTSAFRLARDNGRIRSRTDRNAFDQTLLMAFSPLLQTRDTNDFVKPKFSLLKGPLS